MMYTDEGKQQMMTMLSQTWNKYLPAGQNSLSWNEFKRIDESFNEMHDKAFGGHYIWDDASAKANFDYMASIFGSNGRVTMEQWSSSFPDYVEKIEPYVDCIELTTV